MLAQKDDLIFEYILTDGEEVFEARWMTAEEYAVECEKVNTVTDYNLYWEPAPVRVDLSSRFSEALKAFEPIMRERLAAEQREQAEYEKRQQAFEAKVRAAVSAVTDNFWVDFLDVESIPLLSKNPWECPPNFRAYLTIPNAAHIMTWIKINLDEAGDFILSVDQSKSHFCVGHHAFVTAIDDKPGLGWKHDTKLVDYCFSDFNAALGMALIEYQEKAGPAWKLYQKHIEESQKDQTTMQAEPDCWQRLVEAFQECVERIQYP